MTRQLLVVILTASLITAGCSDTPQGHPTPSTTAPDRPDASASMNRADVAELLSLLSPVLGACPPPTVVPVLTGEFAALLEVLGLAPPATDPCPSPEGTP